MKRIYIIILLKNKISVPTQIIYAQYISGEVMMAKL